MKNLAIHLIKPDGENPVIYVTALMTSVNPFESENGMTWKDVKGHNFQYTIILYSFNIMHLFLKIFQLALLLKTFDFCNILDFWFLCFFYFMQYSSETEIELKIQKLLLNFNEANTKFLKTKEKLTFLLWGLAIYLASPQFLLWRNPKAHNLLQISQSA